jgi:hypothetical protein
MAAATQAAVVPPTIDQQWADVLRSTPQIEALPVDHRALCNWVRSAATSIGGIASDNDRLGVDPYTNGYVLESYFEPLQGGTLMNALGNNNDCLVHSFLSCVCPNFRKYDAPIRSTIASFFRRFMMTRMDFTEDGMRELKSYDFLDTNALSILCVYFRLQFIIVKKGKYPVDRHIEFIPEFDDTITYNWRPLNNKNRGPFYVIHGSGAHFTPVAWNNNYALVDKNFIDLRNIADKINREAGDDQVQDERRKRNTERKIHDFLSLYDLNVIRDRIDEEDDQKEKDDILSEHVIQLGAQLDRYINTLNETECRRDYAGSIAVDSIIRAIIGEPVNMSSANYNLSTNHGSFEPDVDLKAALEDSLKIQKEKEERNAATEKEQLNKALQNSLQITPNHNQNAKDLQTGIMLSMADKIKKYLKDGIEQSMQSNSSTQLPQVNQSIKPTQQIQSTQVNQPIQPNTQHNSMNSRINTNGVTGKVSNAVLRAISGVSMSNIQPMPGKVLSTLSGITATVGTNSGKYMATVYEPVVSQQLQGGKRNTKKAKRVKKQKTKKLKKRSV